MLQRRIIIILILIFCVSIIYSQTDNPGIILETWYRTQPGAASYNSIKDRLLILFTQSVTRNIPLQLLVERLSEGASKHIPAEKLYTAIEEETGRLTIIIGMIRNINKMSLSLKKTDFFNIFKDDMITKEKSDNELAGNEWLRQLSIINRGGLSVDSMEGLFTFALQENRSKDAVLLLLHSFLKIPGISGLTEEDIDDLGKALISSSLSPSSYSTLSSIFLKGRVAHLSNETIKQIIIDILKQGGGLVRIEQEIARRGKKK